MSETDALPDLAVNADVELRPAVLRTYSDNTLGCYSRRLAHYQRWCAAQSLQSSVAHIDDAKLLAYVQAQIDRWKDPEETNGRNGRGSGPYVLLRPDSIKQAISSLVYHAEKAGLRPPDSRPARELLNAFAAKWNRSGQGTLYRIPGRRNPRTARRTT
ncbi:hypothetical protein [Saccharothrix sp. HUAS TT1]|uniref:hypothetical protein n=1 Tax=unclassified Saccharothrix TaxID=2593673 RepID=UPI00345BEB97